MKKARYKTVYVIQFYQYIENILKQTVETVKRDIFQAFG